ncbi:hypothetical protein AMJ44_11325 [candidate division WOR-1 bacterium DG_54_3]|uniref:Aldehyde oxidase/xanthine dehydrogenase a/b hammerhead domain-containing protein n=1 Tax=candidate division WOR-1 bacterium DG_54_3 TaxID=1703775 RepID=A0A0S7XSJ7_UNCSA|nr:MAG: hypothetical protein AMJ44_11325 [candidate division WOR-1 bacterium DG_54_3]
MELEYIGKKFPNIDGFEKVSGEGKYCYDLILPNMLWGKILRSYIPHGRIVNINTDKAKRVPGVRAVVTYRDFPDCLCGMGGIKDEPLIARGKVRYIGEPVAAVAAEDEFAAEEAIDLIEVEYEELPAVFDPEESMGENPLAVIHEDRNRYGIPQFLIGSMAEWSKRPNLCCYFRIRKGDPRKGLDDSYLVLEDRFKTPMVSHVPLEPHNCIAQFNYNGKLTVWTSTQSPYTTVQQLEYGLKVPHSRIRVIVPRHVGGGFGGKIELTNEGICAILSREANSRPVKIKLSRDEVFTTTPARHPFIIDLKTGVKKDGTISAIEFRSIANTGAYGGLGVVVIKNTGHAIVGQYKIPNLKFDAYGVYTSQIKAGAFRGFGMPQQIFAIESHMDMIASKLGIDPVEIRLKNILKEGDTNAINEVMHSVGSEECLKEVTRSLGLKKKSESEGVWKRGKGIALGTKYSTTATSVGSCCFVKVYDDGTIEVRQSGIDLGQGQHTVLAQIAAEEFSTPLSNIIVVPVDTDYTPTDTLTGSQRQTFYMGNALRLACSDAKKQIFKLASKLLEADPGDLDIKNGQIFVKESPNKSVPLRAIFMEGPFFPPYLPGSGEILGRAAFIYPLDSKDIETGQCPMDGYRRSVAFYTQIAHGVEIEVNLETGQVRLVKLVAAIDVGRAINLLSIEGQSESALSQGLGTALSEELFLDNGKIVNPNLADYKIPTTLCPPPNKDVKTIIIETYHKDGPFGAKGMGEAVILPMFPAVANAIYDAVGVRIKEPPFTPEKVFNALRQMGK